jgi:hypothetical protein
LNRHGKLNCGSFAAIATRAKPPTFSDQSEDPWLAMPIKP